MVAVGVLILETSMTGAIESQLNHHLNQESEAELRAEAIAQLIKDKTELILNDEPIFEQIDKDYELDVYGQTMRALRSLDKAIKQSNVIHQQALKMCSSDLTLQGILRARIEIDAVFTALSNIQKNLDKAVEHEATKEYDGSL